MASLRLMWVHGAQLHVGALHLCSPRIGMLGFCASPAAFKLRPSSISSHPLPPLPIMFFTWTLCPASSLASLPLPFFQPRRKAERTMSLAGKAPYYSSQDGDRWADREWRKFQLFSLCILERRQGCCEKDAKMEGQRQTWPGDWTDRVKSDTFVLR